MVFLKVTVIVPIYNEESVIEESVTRLIKELKLLNKEWELILVNDGSTDNTLNILHDLAKKEERIRILSYTPNRGRGKALRTGFERASGDIVVTMESDCPYGEKIVGRMVSLLESNSGVDVVIASPNLKGGGYENVPFVRKFLSSLGNKLICSALPGDLTTATGMIRAYRRDVIQPLSLSSDDKEIHLEILSKILAAGHKVVEIPVTLRWDKSKLKRKKKKKSSFRYRKFIFSHLGFTFNESLVSIIGLIGFLLLSIGFIIGLYVLFLWLNTRLNEGRPMIIFAVVLLLVGLQIILFSFLADQNRKTQQQLVLSDMKINKSQKRKR